MRTIYRNGADFNTLEEAQEYVIESILKKINSYEIVEQRLSSDKIKWILNIYKGEIFSFDEKPTLMEYKVPYVAEFTFSKKDKWQVSGVPYSIEDLLADFSIKYKSLISYLEKVILQVSWSGLLNIAQVENSVTPFYDIVRKIVRVGKITNKDIRDLEIKRNKSFEKYLSLLAHAGIIEHEKDGFTFTNTSRKLLMDSKFSKEAAHKVMAYFISQTAPQLIHGMHLYPLKSYVSLENAYYIPTLQLRSMKKINMKAYEKIYRRINNRRLSRGYIFSLYKLDEVGLIEVQRDQYIIGVEDKYNEMSTQYNQVLNYT